MNKYIWQSGKDEHIDESIADFTAGEDIVLDRELFPYDIRATAAHVRGLARIGILDEQEEVILWASCKSGCCSPRSN